MGEQFTQATKLYVRTLSSIASLLVHHMFEKARQQTTHRQAQVPRNGVEWPVAQQPVVRGPLAEDYHQQQYLQRDVYILKKDERL